MNLRMNTANCFKYSSKLMAMITELKSIQMEFWEWLSGKGTGNHKTYNLLSPLLDFTISSCWR